jgi:hypothetical protein
MAGETPSFTLPVKVIPGAPRSQVVGWLGEAAKVKVQAPPLEGRANEALLRFLAEELDLPPRCVELVRGDTSRQKLVRITGLERAEACRRLGLG